MALISVRSMQAAAEESPDTKEEAAEPEAEEEPAEEEEEEEEEDEDEIVDPKEKLEEGGCTQSLPFGTAAVVRRWSKVSI